MKLKLSFLSLVIVINAFLIANEDHYLKGIEAFKKRDFPEAKKHLNSAQETTITGVLASLKLGEIFLTEKKNSDAQTAFNNAVKINHDYGCNFKNIHTHIATIYEKHNLHTEAKDRRGRAKLLRENQ